MHIRHTTDSRASFLRAASTSALLLAALLLLPATQAISANSNHSLTVRADGTVWAWGNNDHGQLGDGTLKPASLPKQVKGGTGKKWLGGIKAVSAGLCHSLAVGNDGTVWAWGWNDQGQLGNGTAKDSHVPVQVKDSSGKGRLEGIVAVSAGFSHSLALANDGTVWAWGSNTSGQLGDKTATDRTLPVQVKDSSGEGKLEGIVAISAGDVHSLALSNDGTVWAWGANNHGQLGDETTDDRSKPMQVKDSSGGSQLGGIKGVSAGFYHSLAVGNDGFVWAWGRNDYGQLGDWTTEDRSKPVQVKDSPSGSQLGGIKSVSAGVYHSLALGDDGSVWAWGNNEHGQLDDETSGDETLDDETIDDRCKPVQVKYGSGTDSLGGIKAISSCGEHSLAVGNDGSVWAWGRNHWGQLGDGTTADRGSPVRVKGPDSLGFLDLTLYIIPHGSTGDKPHTTWFKAFHSSAATLKKWSFGDGATSKESAPSHTFTEAGVYPVTLTVDAQGSEQSTSVEVVVQDPYSSDGGSTSPGSGGSAGGCSLGPGADYGLEWLLLAGGAMLVRMRKHAIQGPGGNRM